MARRKVISREYKVMLRPARFVGDEKALRHAANAFWRDFSQGISDVAVRTEGELGELKANRLVAFFDTPTQQLNAGAYLFRERRDLDDEGREITLKFRHPDRHVAADRRMDPRRGRDARTKFEEDIKPPFVSLYSFSTTLPVDGKKTFNQLKDVARLFPDVPDRLENFPHDEQLQRVGGFTARELVYGGAHVRMSRKPKTDAECALIVWYDHDGSQDKPCVVEFSFRYANKNEKYDGKMSRRAFETFNVLQNTLETWVDPKPRTKTAFVYA
jgi:hypothetical protein